MTRYDLEPFSRLPGVRLGLAFRWALRGGVIALWAGLAWSLAFGPFPTGERALALPLVSALLGTLGFAAFAWGSQATSLTLGNEGIVLEYGRRKFLIGKWSDPRIVIRGVRTEGVDDYQSRGRPRQAIWGRMRGLSTSWIPPEAYEEAIRLAKEHGLHMEEVPVRRGWTRYTLRH